MSGSRALLGAALVACLSGWPTAAPGAPREVSRADLVAAEARATEAKAFFRAGLHQQAARGFMQAYALSGEPALMFNAARSYEEAGQPREAAALFEQYLKLSELPADGRADAEARITALRKKLAAMDKQRAPAASAKAADASKAVDAGIQPDARKEADAGKPPDARREPDARKEADTGDPTKRPSPTRDVRSAAPPATATADDEAPLGGRALTWTLVGTGGALELVSLLLWADARAKVDAANGMSFATFGAPGAYADKIDAAKQQRTNAIIVAAVGAPLLAWGAYRLASAPAQPPRGATARASGGLTSTVLAPTVMATASGTAPGLVLGGRW